MKKCLCLFLIIMCLFSLVACNKQTPLDGESTKETSQTLYIDPSHFTFSVGNGEIAHAVSKNAFTKPIELTFNDEKITIDTPKFTGIPVASVYSYKKSYQFINGYVIFEVATDYGLTYFKVDKNGKIVSTSKDYQAIIADRDQDKYMKEFILPTKPVDYRVVGNNVMIKQFGEPGDYVQYLYSVDGERLSEGYDSIGYFFNGLALTIKHNKIGLIDEKGTAVLTPNIEFDAILYPPKDKGFYLDFMFEDAFVIPINGEFAIINIQRSNN